MCGGSAIRERLRDRCRYRHEGNLQRLPGGVRGAEKVAGTDIEYLRDAALFGHAESTIDLLVKADFAKTKTLTNRFERPEVRVLAKMLVLRSVLGKKEAATPTPANTDELK